MKDHSRQDGLTTYTLCKSSDHKVAYNSSAGHTAPPYMQEYCQYLVMADMFNEWE